MSRRFPMTGLYDPSAAPIRFGTQARFRPPTTGSSAAPPTPTGPAGPTSTIVRGIASNRFSSPQISAQPFTFGPTASAVATTSLSDVSMTSEDEQHSSFLKDLEALRVFCNSPDLTVEWVEHLIEKFTVSGPWLEKHHCGELLPLWGTLKSKYTRVKDLKGPQAPLVIYIQCLHAMFAKKWAKPDPQAKYPADQLSGYSSDTSSVTKESSIPAVTMVNPTPAVTVVSPTPAVTIVNPTPAVTMVSPTPAITMVNPTPAVTIVNPTPAVTMAKPTPAVTVKNPLGGAPSMASKTGPASTAATVSTASVVGLGSVDLTNEILMVSGSRVASVELVMKCLVDHLADYLPKPPTSYAGQQAVSVVIPPQANPVGAAAVKAKVSTVLQLFPNDQSQAGPISPTSISSLSAHVQEFVPKSRQGSVASPSASPLLASPQLAVPQLVAPQLASPQLVAPQPVILNVVHTPVQLMSQFVSGPQVPPASVFLQGVSPYRFPGQPRPLVESPLQNSSVRLPTRVQGLSQPIISGPAASSASFGPISTGPTTGRPVSTGHTGPASRPVASDSISPACLPYTTSFINPHDIGKTQATGTPLHATAPVFTPSSTNMSSGFLAAADPPASTLEGSTQQGGDQLVTTNGDTVKPLLPHEQPLPSTSSEDMEDDEDDDSVVIITHASIKQETAAMEEQDDVFEEPVDIPVPLSDEKKTAALKYDRLELLLLARQPACYRPPVFDSAVPQAVLDSVRRECNSFSAFDPETAAVPTEEMWTSHPRKYAPRKYESYYKNLTPFGSGADGAGDGGLTTASRRISFQTPSVEKEGTGLGWDYSDSGPTSASGVPPTVETGLGSGAGTGSLLEANAGFSFGAGAGSGSGGEPAGSGGDPEEDDPWGGGSLAATFEGAAQT